MLITASINANAQVCNGTSQLTLLGTKGNGIFHQLQLASIGPNDADPSQNEIIAEAWTCNGIGYPICNFRAITKYKLSQIPKGAYIISAKLYLYARTNSTNAIVGSPTYGTDNAVSISRVTTPWDTSGVGFGWNNQPQTTNDNQVVLSTSTSIAQNYVADLQQLVQFWTNNPDSNFGVQLKTINETYYKSMIFHSGTSVSTLQPRLEICYFTEDMYPKIYGTAFYDANNNGIKDSSEFATPYTKVGLSNGSFTFTDANGYYEIATNGLGNFGVDVAAPNFYNASNLLTNYNFNRYDTVVANNIAFVATSNIDSVNIHIVPYRRFARPGFAFPCFVEYENLGNTILTPNIGVAFDSSKMIYDSCSSPLFMGYGSSFGGTTPSIKPGERHYFTGYVTTKATTSIFDTLTISAGVITGTAMATDEIRVPVNGSYDPNAIEATPSLTPQQVALGKYIDYTIHFENIGNDTAINIVVKDTLSSLLQANTLQIITASHPCKLTVVGNKIKVEFKNINLLYTSLNALKSSGFVKFKIKPLSTVTLGTAIPNKASIYFDFNAPIVTNIAITIIKNAAIITPLSMVSYKVVLVNEKQVLNNWTTANEVNVSYFNIERSVNGKSFETIGKIEAKNKAENSYSFTDDKLTITNEKLTLYYRLKSVDNNGATTYSTIKTVTINNSQLTIHIFPNPAKNIVNIECANAKQLLVIDYLGRIVKQLKVNSNKLVVNVNDLSKGIYSVQMLTANGKMMNQKLIVE